MGIISFIEHLALGKTGQLNISSNSRELDQNVKAAKTKSQVSTFKRVKAICTLHLVVVCRKVDHFQ